MPANEPRAAVLLDDIHATLLRRDYAALPALEAALTAELDRPSRKLDAAGLATIRRRADRNAATLVAVQRGIRAALRRIAEIKSVSAGTGTYDRSGRRAEPTTGRNLAARL